MKKQLILPLLLASLWAPAVPVVAQSTQGSQNSMSSLPPALRAAVQSGNAEQVNQAIATLSGGDSTRAAALANQVMKAAEQLLSTNPQAAIAAASAAVETVRAMAVQQSAPTQTETVLTTAARIFVNPDAQRVAPNQVAALAQSTLAVAATTNNPGLVASTASQAVSTAEKILSINPTAAVQIAAAAVSAVQSSPVQSNSPQNALQTVVTAARILVRPEAQAVDPKMVASVAAAVTQVVTNPVVYQANPSAAIQVMASAYGAATNPTVSAAAPTAASSIVASLNQASANGQLNSANPTNSSQINEILARRGGDTNTLINRDNNYSFPRQDTLNSGSPT